MRICLTACSRWYLAASLLVALSSSATLAQQAGDPLIQDPPLQEALAAAKSAGFLITPQELQIPLPPEDQNAAPLYLQLNDLYFKSKQITSEDDLLMEALANPRASQEQFAAARRLLDEKKEVFTRLHQAVSRPQCVFQKDYTLGPALLFPELKTMRMSARFLLGESALQLHEGKPEDAVRTASLVFHIVNHLLQGRATLHCEVALAVDAMALRTLGAILNAAGDRSTVRTALLQALKERPAPPSPAVMLRSRIAFGVGEAEVLLWSDERLRASFGIPKASKDVNAITLFRELSAVGELSSRDLDDEVKPIVLPINPTMPSRKDTAAYTAWVNANKRATILTLSRMLTELNKPFDQYIGVEANIVTGLGMETINAFVKSGQKPSSNVIASLKAQDTYELLRHRGSDYAQARGEILRMATLLVGYKADHGSFPEQLEAVLSPAPLDPFDGKPLKYRREGEGFVLYAVGRNHDFDGGQPNTRVRNTEAVLRYPFPTRSKQTDLNNQQP